MLQQTVPSTAHAVLIERLASISPNYHAALERFQDELATVAAVARAADQLSRHVPGSSPLGSGAMLGFEVAVPRLPSYSGRPRVVDLSRRIDASARDLLTELGIGHLAR